MRCIIREQEDGEVNACECGAYPMFVQPDCHYTDIWLKCPVCGKSTYNTGGYHYASEIPLHIAKKDAIKAWNNKLYST